MKGTELAGLFCTCRGVFLLRAKVYRMLVLGGGNVDTSRGMGEAFSSLHYKLYAQTASSIQVTSITHSFVFIPMYSSIHSFFQSLDLKLLGPYYAPMCVPEGCWAPVMNSSQLVVGLTAKY